ncbi:hypothetical protein KEM55_004086 [Ascosphaera atra]|nr:hypothetical protein KEM55_004086 [Ascosphaera atra]
MWSIGCIFGELLLKEPLLQAKNEVEQLAKIFDLTGPPTSQTWPGWRSLPNAKSLRLPNAPKPPAESKGPITPLLPRTKFPSYLTNAGLSLLSNLLALHPGSRPTAAEALNDGYFREDPKPKAKAMFPTFPSKAGLEKRRRRATPEAPKHGEEVPHLDFASAFGGGMSSGSQGAGFSLRFG